MAFRGHMGRTGFFTGLAGGLSQGIQQTQQRRQQQEQERQRQQEFLMQQGFLGVHPQATGQPGMTPGQRAVTSPMSALNQMLTPDYLRNIPEQPPIAGRYAGVPLQATTPPVPFAERRWQEEAPQRQAALARTQAQTEAEKALTEQRRRIKPEAIKTEQITQNVNDLIAARNEGLITTREEARQAIKDAGDISTRKEYKEALADFPPALEGELRRAIEDKRILTWEEAINFLRLKQGDPKDYSSLLELLPSESEVGDIEDIRAQEEREKRGGPGFFRRVLRGER